MNGNGNGNLAASPIEVNLDGCEVNVLEGKDTEGGIHRQLRITHRSGLLPVRINVTLPEAAAVKLAYQLSGSKITIADAINEPPQQ